MKKIILTAVLAASLLANESNVVDTNVTQPTVQETTASQSESSGITTKDVAVAIGVPIFVAGAVVAAVVVSPIWLVKKVFE